MRGPCSLCLQEKQSRMEKGVPFVCLNSSPTNCSSVGRRKAEHLPVSGGHELVSCIRNLKEFISTRGNSRALRRNYRFHSRRASFARVQNTLFGGAIVILPSAKAYFRDRGRRIVLQKTPLAEQGGRKTGHLPECLTTKCTM